MKLILTITIILFMGSCQKDDIVIPQIKHPTFKLEKVQKKVVTKKRRIRKNQK